MSEIEFEVDDDRPVPIERSHLMWARCRCGARALAAPGRTARCSSCALADAASARAPEPVVGLPPLGAGHAPAVAAPSEPYPAPLVTSRDPWDGQDCPSPVLKLAQRAAGASWSVRVQRSRGCAPHGATGHPGPVKWRYGVVLSRRDGAWSAYAVHDGASWSSVMLWGASMPWFPHASITDLAEWIAAGGDMGEDWYARIRERVSGADARRKARLKCDRGDHGETSLFEGGAVSCSICGNVWHIGDDPWSKPRKGKGEAL